MFRSITTRLGLGRREEEPPTDDGLEPRRCYTCREVFRADPGVLEGRCPACGRATRLGDWTITGWHWSGAVVTAGTLVVGLRGRITSGGDVFGGVGVRIEGRVEGLVVSGGLVTIGPRAELIGGVCAPALRIEEGARVRGGPFEVWPDEERHARRGAGTVRLEPWRAKPPEPSEHPFVCPAPVRTV